MNGPWSGIRHLHQQCFLRFDAIIFAMAWRRRDWRFVCSLWVVCLTRDFHVIASALSCCRRHFCLLIIMYNFTYRYRYIYVYSAAGSPITPSQRNSDWLSICRIYLSFHRFEKSFAYIACVCLNFQIYRIVCISCWCQKCCSICTGLYALLYLSMHVWMAVYVRNVDGGVLQLSWHGRVVDKISNLHFILYANIW